jgi:hypothetical protein
MELDLHSSYTPSWRVGETFISVRTVTIGVVAAVIRTMNLFRPRGEGRGGGNCEIEEGNRFPRRSEERTTM